VQNAITSFEVKRTALVVQDRAELSREGDPAFGESLSGGFGGYERKGGVRGRKRKIGRG